MKIVKLVITFISTVAAARMALTRLRQAREDDDSLELVDAALNGLVVVTGTIIIIRRLRSGKEDDA